MQRDCLTSRTTLIAFTSGGRGCTSRGSNRCDRGGRGGVCEGGRGSCRKSKKWPHYGPLNHTIETNWENIEDHPRLTNLNWWRYSNWHQKLPLVLWLNILFNTISLIKEEDTTFKHYLESVLIQDFTTIHMLYFLNQVNIIYFLTNLVLGLLTQGLWL